MPLRFLGWLVKQTHGTQFSRGPRSSSNSKFLINFLLLPKKSKIISPGGGPGLAVWTSVAPCSGIDLESDSLEAVVKCSKRVHCTVLSAWAPLLWCQSEASSRGLRWSSLRRAGMLDALRTHPPASSYTFLPPCKVGIASIPQVRGGHEVMVGNMPRLPS